MTTLDVEPRKTPDVDLLVAYCGRYNVTIGPPASMRALADLLQVSYAVAVTDNLKPSMVQVCRSRSDDLVSPGLIKRAISRAKKNWFVKEASLFVHIVMFNWKIFRFCRKRSGAVVIVTQPFVVPYVLNNARLIYIRRANKAASVVLSRECVTKFFESWFVSSTKNETVYLVPSDEYHVDTVIPNHFEVERYRIDVTNVKDNPSFYWVGTWDIRKGAARLMLLASNYPNNFPLVQVYGNLGYDSEVNDWLINAPNTHYFGVVEEPYEKFCVGDVFLSLSHLEGFQRALVEAMLKGCVVIATRRPDSALFDGISGVRLIEWDDNDELASVAELAASIQEFSDMPIRQRVDFGLENRKAMADVVSAGGVVQKWDAILRRDM